MLFILDASIKSGAVYDGLIKSVQNKPMAAQVMDRGNGVWRYRLRVKGSKSGNDGRVSLGYSAMLNTKTGRVSLSGSLAGFDNNISGAGLCRVVTG